MLLRQVIYNNWKGTWNSTFNYILNDVTEKDGTSYICILNHTDQEPPNLTYWNILASKGDIGTTIASEVTTDETGISVQDWLDSLQGISHTHANKITIDKFDEDKYNSLITGLSTGICHGGILSINTESGTPNTFDISAGDGQIVDSSDCENPIITNIEWDEKIGEIDNYRTIAPETFIAIDINGNIIQETEWFDDEDKRNYIILGTVGHNDLNNFEYIICEPVLSLNPNLQFDSFCEALGAFNIEGNVFSANGTNLKINKSSGKTFDSGANYVNSIVYPSIITTNYEPATMINYNFTESGTLWSFAELLEVDPNHYDTLNGLSDVPDGKWTIQTIYQYAPLDYNEMQYGQVCYDSKEEALAKLSQDFEVAPLLEFDTFRGWLIVIKDADDLSDIEQANFITAGKFGMTGGGAGGGGGGEITTASNVGLGGIGLYLQKLGANLEFKNIRPASNKVTVVNNPTEKTVDIDVTIEQGEQGIQGEKGDKGDAGGALEYYYAESTGESSTTSDIPSYTNKLTYTLTPVAGIYILEWNYCMSHNTAGGDYWTRVQKDSVVLRESRFNNPISYANKGWMPYSGFLKLTLTAISTTFTIDFCRNNAGTAWIRDAKLLLRRVA